MIKVEELSSEKFEVFYVESQHKVMLKGVMNIRSMDEYSKIRSYIFDLFKNSDLPLTIDLISLISMNSSGIATLGLLMVKTREIDRKIYIHGDEHSF